MGLSKGAVVLFQGDSITDAGRSRDDFASACYPTPPAALSAAAPPAP